VLPNHDRRELKKIEDRMRASDPAFAETLDRGLGPGESRQWKILLISADITVALMIVVGILTGDSALFLWGVPAACGLVWAHQALKPGGRSRTIS
jgi:hypothetical protein